MADVYLALVSPIADGGVAHFLETRIQFTAGKLYSWRTGGVEKAFVDFKGSFFGAAITLTDLATMQGGAEIGSTDTLNDPKNRLQFLGAAGVPRGFIQSSELAVGDLIIHSEGNTDIRLDPAGTGNTTVVRGGFSVAAGTLLAAGANDTQGALTLQSIKTAVVADETIGAVTFIGFDLSGGGPGPRAAIEATSIEATGATYRLSLFADDGAGLVEAARIGGPATGSSFLGTLAVVGALNAQADLVVTGEILSPTSAGSMFLSGDTSTSTGANIVLRGGGFGGAPGDILLRAATTERLKWDQSASKWIMSSDFDLAGSFAALGTGPHTLAGTSIFGDGNPVNHSGVTPTFSIQGSVDNARLSGMTLFITNANGPIWSFAKSAAGGATLAYPNLNDNLGGIWWHGADPTAGRFNPGVRLFVEAASQWAVSNFHTRMIFAVTPSGSTTITEILRLQDATATFTGEVEINGAFNHDGSTFGVFDTTPAAQTAAYTPTNVTPDRAYDANLTTVDELADVLGTVIADLQLYGLLA